MAKHFGKWRSSLFLTTLKHRGGGGGRVSFNLSVFVFVDAKTKYKDTERSYDRVEKVRESVQIGKQQRGRGETEMKVKKETKEQQSEGSRGSRF